MSTPDPPRPSLGHRLLSPLVDGLAALAVASYRRPLLALLLLLAGVGASSLGLRQLRIDSDFAALLPENLPSVRALDTLRKRFGGVGFVSVVARGSDPEGLRRFADEVAPRLRELDTVRSVDARWPVEYFEERALHWMDTEDLAEVADRLEARYRWEVARRSPFFLDLDDEPPPDLDFSALEEEYRRRLGGGRASREDPAYHTDQAGERLVILVRPTQLASDLSFARRVVDDVQAIIDELDTARYGGDFEVALSGRYKKRVDLQELVSQDVNFAGLLSLAMVGLYLLLHFRRVTAVPLVVVPLIVSLLFTYGLAGFTVGTLTLLTALIATVLTGIGVDNGIHLLSAYDEARAGGADEEDAVREAFRAKSRAAVAASLTTIAAFLCVALSEFQAFREFGLLAALGMLLSTLAYFTCMPALLAFAPKPRSRPVARVVPPRVMSWLPGVAGLLLLGGLYFTTHAPSVHFQYDFAVLDDADLPSYHLDREVNTILGRSQTPLVLVGETQQELAEMVELVRQHSKERGEESTVAHVVSLSDFLPKESDLKAPLLSRIAEAADKLLTGAENPEQRSALTRVRDSARSETPARENLPELLGRTFSPGGDGAEVALVYPSVSLSDGASAERIQDELGALQLDDGRIVSAAGEAMVLAEVIRSVRSDSGRILVSSVIATWLLLWLVLGRIRDAALAAMPAVLTLAATLGAMAAFGIELNYMNILVFPVLIGIGVDGGCYYVARWSSGEDPAELIGGTNGAVAGAIITTVLGFGALFSAAHPGISSIGAVAIIGMGVNLLAASFVLPGLLVAVSESRGSSLSAVLSNVGRLGHLPRAGGSFGALVAIPLAWAMSGLPMAARVSIAAAVCVGAIFVVRRYMAGPRATSPRHDDPQEVVLDEVVGCLLTLSMIPFELPWIVAGYVLFRLLDILKPWPVSWAERRFSGASGVVLDDVVAGALAGIALASLAAFLG